MRETKTLEQYAIRRIDDLENEVGDLKALVKHYLGELEIVEEKYNKASEVLHNVAGAIEVGESSYDGKPHYSMYLVNDSHQAYEYVKWMMDNFGCTEKEEGEKSED